MATLAILMKKQYIAMDMALSDTTNQRGNFARAFLGAMIGWDGSDSFEGDTPLFKDPYVSDSYVASMFYPESPKKFPCYVLRGLLNANKESFVTWLNQMTGDEWEHVKVNMSQIGVKIENAEDLYVAVCESVKNELAEREKPAGEAPMEVEEEKKPEKKPETETSALRIVVRDGLGAAMPLKSAEAAVQSYCMMADNPASHPFLFLSVEGSTAELILNRRTDGQHHLLLPQTVPTEMLVSREVYGAVSAICHKMPVVVHNAERNSFFLKKLAEAMADPDDFMPFDDQNATITFAVRNGFFIYDPKSYDSYDAALDAWQESPMRRVVTLIYENEEENLRVSAHIASLGHFHYENVYTNPVLMASGKIKAFLSEHSTGKRTLFGIN